MKGLRTVSTHSKILLHIYMIYDMRLLLYDILTTIKRPVIVRVDKDEF